MTTFLKSRQLYEASILAYQGEQLYLEENKGQMTSDTPFAIASISKLYTDAIVFQLIDQGKLTYDTSLTDILPPEMTKHLPQAEQVTVRHLLDQISGFPNYEMDRQTNGKVLIDDLYKADRRVAFEEALEMIAELPAGTCLDGDKAYYADINAMLLGKMAETVTGQTAEQLLEHLICQPLQLSQTHWATGHEKLAPLYNGQQTIAFQAYLSSQVYQGGIVATNRELMTFIRAFFTGRLFAKSHIQQPTFRPIQFRPLKYGSGMMQLTISSFMSLFFGGAHEIRGQSGITGSFAFYCPEKDVFVTGTFNQTKKRPYPTIFRAIAAGVKRQKDLKEER